ncbi:hypothetical protein [Lentilactobacillus kosonis]|uniref:hypothetical protein n=1 Tax=Lentilactobacillus kosonis TaxID=2810561 RepID=UPI00135C6052|nr:hypothetical protein [Lentilactobacillus kosonis]
MVSLIVLVGLSVLVVSGCEEKSDQDVLIQFPWKLKVSSNDRLSGNVIFTSTKMKYTQGSKKENFNYTLDDNDTFVIKNGKFAGKYKLLTDTTDYVLRPYSKSLNKPKIDLIRND